MESTGDELGPQNDTDGPFEARMRLHQSWYRAQVLGLPHGDGPTVDGGQPLGSMLRREDAAAGSNFLDPTIFATAQRRMRSGWGVEPFRCLANMLSSQPMCFNLWGPLVSDTDLATRLMRTLLPDVERVVEVHLVYAPSPRVEYLGDRTAFDAFVGYVRPDGTRTFVGVATRLVDASTSSTQPTDRYRELAHEPGAPWVPDAYERMASGRSSDLWRTHLLVEALRRHPAEPYSDGRFALVHHPADEWSAAVVDEYRAALREPERTFAAWPLDDLVARWERAGLSDAEQRWLAAFRMRYVDLHHSDEAWAQHSAAGRAAAPAGDRA